MQSTFSLQALDSCMLVAHVQRCGNDIALTVCGGSLHHIGSVALAQPEDSSERQATVSVLCAYGHRDDEVARRMAKRIAGLLGCTVSASVGIHIDNASLEDIATIVKACDALAGTIVDAFRTSEETPVKQSQPSCTNPFFS